MIKMYKLFVNIIFVAVIAAIAAAVHDKALKA